MTVTVVIPARESLLQAIAAIEAAGAAQVVAVNAAGDAVTETGGTIDLSVAYWINLSVTEATGVGGDIYVAVASGVTTVTTAGTTQTGVVNAAGAAQVAAVAAQGVTSIADVAAQGVTSTAAVAAQGTTSVGLVTTEGNTQVARVAGTPGSTLYVDTTAGLAATASGSYFMVVGSGDTVATVYKDNAGVAEVQEAFPSYDYVAAAVAALSSVSSLNDKLAPTRKGSHYNKSPTDTLNSDRSFTIGVPTPTTGTAMPVGTYLNVGHPTPAGALKSFVFYASGTKTIKLKRFSVDGLVYTMLDEISLNVVAGTNTFTLAAGTLTNGGNAWTFAEGNFLAVYVPATAGYYTVTTSNVMEYLFLAGDVTTTTTTAASPNPIRTNQLQYLATFTSSPRTLDIHPLELATNTDTVTIGPYAVTATDTYITTRTTYYAPEFDGLEAQRNLKTIRTNAVAAVNMAISVYDLDSDGEGLTRSRLFHIAVPSGLGTLTAGTDFPPDVVVKPGGTIAFMQITNISGLYGGTTQGSAFHWTNTNAPPATITKTAWSSNNTASRPQIAFDLVGIKPTRRRKYLFDYTFSTYIPRSLYQTGWSVSGGYAVNSAITLTNNQLRWNSASDLKRTAVSGTARFYLKLAATSSVAVFRNRATGSSGSIATIENTTGVICFRAAYAGGTTLPAASVATTTASWMVGNTNELRVDLVKNHYAVSLTVTDTVTGDTATVSRTAAQGVADRPIIGLCMGAPGVSAITGTVYVRRMLFKPERARCDTLYVGDSITHGEGGSTGVDGFAYQAAALSNGMICGIPGELSASTVTFLRAELQAWNPKNVVVMIGTNDTVTATWQTNVTRLYDDIVAYGATPYFCTLPPEAADTNPVNVMNPFIRASGWRYVDMARALTTGADGTTRDAAKFADTVHPNATGYAAMLVRLQADAPELFDEIIT